jgi:hypothetical protein
MALMKRLFGRFFHPRDDSPTSGNSPQRTQSLSSLGIKWTAIYGDEAQGRAAHKDFTYEEHIVACALSTSSSPPKHVLLEGTCTCPVRRVNLDYSASTWGWGPPIHCPRCRGSVEASAKWGDHQPDRHPYFSSLDHARSQEDSLQFRSWQQS